MRDISSIREQAFKEKTIIQAFKTAGISPPNCSLAITQLQKYSKPRKTPILQTLIAPIPASFQDSEAGLQHWKTKLPES